MCSSDLAVGKARDIRLKLPIEIGTLRPWPHKAHVAPQDVPQLGQLIQPSAPEELAETGAAQSICQPGWDIKRTLCRILHIVFIICEELP